MISKEVFKKGTATRYKDKLICVQIDKSTFRVSTCRKDTKQGLNEILKVIKQEIY